MCRITARCEDIVVANDILILSYYTVDTKYDEEYIY